jgi:hypothetical protein
MLYFIENCPLKIHIPHKQGTNNWTNICPGVWWNKKIQNMLPRTISLTRGAEWSYGISQAILMTNIYDETDHQLCEKLTWS